MLRRSLSLSDREFEGTWHIHAWVCLEEINAASQVQKSCLLLKSQEGSSKWQIGALPEQSSKRSPDTDEFYNVNLVLFRRGSKATHLAVGHFRCLVNDESSRTCFVLPSIHLNRVLQQQPSVFLGEMRLSIVLAQLSLGTLYDDPLSAFVENLGHACQKPISLD